jgi:hypothetical protein
LSSSNILGKEMLLTPARYLLTLVLIELDIRPKQSKAKRLFHVADLKNSFNAGLSNDSASICKSPLVGRKGGKTSAVRNHMISVLLTVLARSFFPAGGVSNSPTQL